MLQDQGLLSTATRLAELRPSTDSPTLWPTTAIGGLRVVLSDGDGAEAAIDLALRLGVPLKALIVEEQADLTDYFDEARAAARARVRTAGDHFERLAAKRGVRFSVIDVEIPPNRSYRAIAQHCECSDLVVVEASAFAARDGSRLMDELLAHSRPPVLVLPRPTTGTASCERVVVAWDGDPGTARGIQRVIPLLRLSESVEIRAVGKSGQDNAGAQELANHLTQLGLSAAVAMSPQRSSVEALLAGTRGHRCWIATSSRPRKRFRDFVLGSRTWRMVARTEVPILLLQ